METEMKPAVVEKKAWELSRRVELSYVAAITGKDPALTDGLLLKLETLRAGTTPPPASRLAGSPRPQLALGSGDVAERVRLPCISSGA